MDQPRATTMSGSTNRAIAASCACSGTGVMTGAADDDPSAIGTYASAGAKFGLGFLWIAPVLLPMMYVVVYLSAKLGRVYGEGLFAAVRDRFPRWVLYPVALGAFTGNVIEAAANLGGIGAALNLIVPLPVPLLVTAAVALILAFQFLGSYALLRGLFKAEVIHRCGPWRSFEAVEFATLEWVAWFNTRRLLEPIGNVPPAEAEARSFAQAEVQALAA